MVMRYLLLVVVVFFGCTGAEKKVDDEVMPEDLIGRTIEYRYGESVYHVTLDTDSTMHWEAMAGEEKGAFERETYFMESVGGNRIFITWDEANGIGVSQVLDFNQGKVYNHLLQDRKLRNGHGEIRLLP